MTLKRNHYVSGFNKSNPLNRTRPGTPSLRPSVPGHRLVPEPHFNVKKTSIFDPCPGS